MTELKTLEAQLQVALDRISAAGRALAQAKAGVDADELDQLRADLDEALRARDRAEAQAELTAQQLDTMRDRYDHTLTQQKDALADLDAELQRLREVNRRLEDNNRALRSACETGKVDAALINKAMLTELESMRAQRSVERSEAQAALAAIEPLLPTKEDV